MAEVLSYSNSGDLDGAPARSPLLELLFLAAPTVAQQASYTVLQFIDTWMLSRVGPLEATAAGNAGMLAFSVIGLGIGVTMLVNTLVSQAYGRKDHAACGRYLWQGLWFSIGYAILSLPLILGSHLPYSGSGHEPELVWRESTFFRIALMGTVLKLSATTCGQFLVAINRPMYVLMSTLVSVAMNVLAAWTLIFGHFGFPKMGVAGAAWGTNIALATELTMLLAFCLTPQIRKVYGLINWQPRWNEMKTLLRIGLPTGGQFVADVLAWTLFMMTVMGRFGTAAMAGNTYAFRFWILSFMPAFGIASAVTALVGRYIGRGQPDIAEARAHLGFKVAAVYMIACGVFFYLARFHLIGIFTNDPEILRIGSTVLVFAAIFQFFDALYIVYNNALRGAGDTLVPALAVLILCWGVMLAGGYAVARLLPQYGPAGPWVTGMLYGVLLGAFMFTRFKRGRWKTIDLERKNASDKVPGFEVVPATGAANG